MRKTVIAGIAILLMISMSSGCASNSAQGIPDKTPLLYVDLISDGSSAQSVEALQLTNGWSVVNRYGKINGYEADSFHPLHTRFLDYNEATLIIDVTDGTIELRFSDDFPPQSVSVQRWNAELAVDEQDVSVDAMNRAEQVELTDNKIYIIDNGHDYIYEIYAEWAEGDSGGSSHYAFRTECQRGVCRGSLSCL